MNGSIELSRWNFIAKGPVEDDRGLVSKYYTSVGHKRIQMFAPVAVKVLRLRIRESAAKPLVKAFTA